MGRGGGGGGDANTKGSSGFGNVATSSTTTSMTMLLLLPLLLMHPKTKRRFEERGTSFRPSTLEARVKSAAICRLFDTYVHPIQVSERGCTPKAANEQASDVPARHQHQHVSTYERDTQKTNGCAVCVLLVFCCSLAETAVNTATITTTTTDAAA